MAMKIQVVVFWLVTPCSVKMKSAWPSETSVSYHITTGKAATRINLCNEALTAQVECGYIELETRHRGCSRGKF